MRACFIGLFLVCYSNANAQEGAEEGDAVRGATLYYACESCHWPDGTGSEALDAPAIAGLPSAYVARQLRLFRDGQRGAAAEDLPGRQMGLIAATFPEEQDVLDVSAYVSTMAGAELAQTVAGEAKTGKTRYQTCAPCHGVRGEGNLQLAAPPLTLQQDWYTVRQLKLYRDGLRGSDGDAVGLQMRNVVQEMGDQAMEDVAAYLSLLSRK